MGNRKGVFFSDCNINDTFVCYPLAKTKNRQNMLFLFIITEYLIALELQLHPVITLVALTLGSGGLSVLATNFISRFTWGTYPDIMTAQILYFALGDIASLDVDYLTVYKGMLSDELVKKVKQEDKDLFVWTVNSEGSIREVLQYDIKGIITDYPLRVREIMGRGNE